MFAQSIARFNSCLPIYSDEPFCDTHSITAEISPPICSVITLGKPSICFTYLSTFGSGRLDCNLPVLTYFFVCHYIRMIDPPLYLPQNLPLQRLSWIRPITHKPSHNVQAKSDDYWGPSLESSSPDENSQEPSSKALPSLSPLLRSLKSYIFMSMSLRLIPFFGLWFSCHHSS